MSQNKKDTRQQAEDSTDSTARRSNAVYFLFWLTIFLTVIPPLRATAFAWGYDGLEGEDAHARHQRRRRDRGLRIRGNLVATAPAGRFDPIVRGCIVSQNKKDTRQQAADSMSNTARRSNAVYFLFWLIIKRDGGRLRRTKFEAV